MKATQIQTLLTFLALAACGPGSLKNRTVPEIDDDPQSYAIESAISSLAAALNDSEQTSGYSAELATSCGADRFTPPLGSPNCAGTVDNATVKSIFDSCTVGENNDITLKGTVTLTFDSAATCSAWISASTFPSSGSVTRTTNNFERKNSDGSLVGTSTDGHTNYNSTTIGGGVKTTFKPLGVREVEILGVHRFRTLPTGAAGFDHDIMSLEPIVVSGYKDIGTREVKSGKVRVDHNGTWYSLTAFLTGLKWNATCCYPTSGSISFDRSGNKDGAIAIDFNSGVCGEATLTDSTGETSKLTLTSCE